MGDVRNKDHVHEKGTSQPGDDASSRLRDDAFGSLKKAPGDHTPEKRSKETVNKSVDNPFDHVTLAGFAYRELQTFKGKKDDDKISVSDEKGAVKEVTVRERRAQMEQAFETEMKKGIAAADRIDPERVTSSLWDVRSKMTAKDVKKEELEQLKEKEHFLEAAQHSSSVLRVAYAEFLNEKGDTARAKIYMDQAAKSDPEGSKDPIFKEQLKQVDNALFGRRGEVTDNAPVADPSAILDEARAKRLRGDNIGAEVEYKKAIEAAASLNPELVRQQLEAINKAKEEHKNEPETLKQLDEMTLYWGHTKSIVSANYAEFLISQNRKEEARTILGQIAKDDPELVKDNPDFQQLTKAADESKPPEPFDNPFQHGQNFQSAFEKGDLTTAKAELEAAVKAADKIDLNAIRARKTQIDEQLKTETDAEKRKQLETDKQALDAFEHASVSLRIALARFELAGKNYNNAQELLNQAEARDSEYCKRPEFKFDELKEGAQEPSTWGKVWNWTKDTLKELVCDGAAILAGVGAAVGVGALTSWTGPGLVAAGGAAGMTAGAATYTGMKTLVFGEKFSWSMPMWGALDGVSGGLAGGARVGLTRVAGSMITKEVAENAVLKTGGKVAALEGLEGFQAGKAAQTMAREGLETMAGGLSRTERFLSKIPLLETGNAEYRTALSATNTLGRRMFAANLLRDAGTAGTMSLIYRGGHEGYNYYTGKHKDFSSFAKAYGVSVAGDTITGPMLGFTGRWLGEAISTGLVGKATGVSNLSSLFPRLGAGLDTAIVASGPVGYEAMQTHQYLTHQIEPRIQYHQVPLDLQTNKREFIQRFQRIEQVTSQANSQYSVRDALNPEIENGKVVTPDEDFDPQKVIEK